MQLNAEKGGYYLGPIVRLGGSFRINGTSNPDCKRDGGSNMISSVVRTSTGLFTVTFSDKVGPLPKRLITWNVDLSNVTGATALRIARMVTDSYSQITRTFQIKVFGPTANNDVTLVAADPADNDQISFELVGSISQTGTDPL